MIFNQRAKFKFIDKTYKQKAKFWWLLFAKPVSIVFEVGTPSRIRTHNHRGRNPVLYPVKPWTHKKFAILSKKT